MDKKLELVIKRMILPKYNKISDWRIQITPSSIVPDYIVTFYSEFLNQLTYGEKQEIRSELKTLFEMLAPEKYENLYVSFEVEDDE